MKTINVCFSFCLLFLFLTGYSQISSNMTLSSTWDGNTVQTSGVFYNDLWGYVDQQGNEYAILGSPQKVHFIDITVPTSPSLVYEHVGGGTTIWRDFKTYKQYCYAVADQGAEGLLIFDMSPLPGGQPVLANQITTNFSRAHNIYIDVPNGLAYIAGSNTVNSGMIVYDLNVSATNPPVVYSSSLPGGYVHDVFVQNNIAYASHGYNGFYMHDFSNPSNPVFMESRVTGGYNHSSWITEDNNYIIYAEEVPSGRPMGVLDISDIQNNGIVLTTTFKDPLLAPAHTNSTPHNPYITGDYAVISYYEDGVQIYDVSNPTSPSRAAWYDTAPNNTNYNGTDRNWGVYPFFPSGTIIASDTEDGLFVLQTSLDLASKCNDGVQNGSELGIDCGGFCRPCTSGTTPPNAAFSASPTVTCNTIVAFTDLSSGNPTAWLWEFGDGSTSSSQNPVYTYSSAGTYTVTLTVTNSDGSDSETKTNYINILGSISSFPHTIDFESGAGGITQLTNDDFDWTVRSGSTPSNNTGPTSAYQGSNYFYMESSSPNYPSKVAAFQSDCYDLSSTNTATMVFGYHMYGASMGTLNLEVTTNNGTTWTSVWSLSGDQGNAWNNATVDLSTFTGGDLIYKFTGTTTTSYTSDFSLDQITISTGGPSCTPGTSCNDNDPCTINDVYDNNCNCAGTFQDADNDTVCDANDQCPGFDDRIDLNNNGIPDGCETTSCSTCTATIASFPHTENFEGGAGNICQYTNDNFNWTVATGSTPSSNTGPTNAYQGNNYFYMESSSPNYPSKTAAFRSACYDLSGFTTASIDFWYHMYGATMGTLNLDISVNNGTTWTNVWSLSGNQGNSWANANVDISAYAGSVVAYRFSGTTTTSYTSDFTLDQITVDAGNVSGGECTTCPATISTFPHTLNFESGAGSVCQYTGDDFNWTVSTGSTPSSNTGPTNAYQGNGYFYMESSSPNYPSKVATFQGACYDLSGFTTASIDFWYHMYGATMGTLNLEVSPDNGTTWTGVWSLSGNQGNSWLNATVDLSAYAGGNLSYRFSGTTTTSYTSDFTLDQVTIDAGNGGGGECTTCPATISTFPHTLNFESGAGSVCQYTGDDFNWTVSTGSTPSSNTGPTTAYQGNGYFYMESSSPNYPSKVATFQSVCYDLNGFSTASIDFWYHMYGATMGTLNLEVSSNNGTSWTNVWSLSGNQGNSWLNATVDLSAYAGGNLSYRFAGTTTTSFTSDFTLDQVTVDAGNGGGGECTTCPATISTFPHTLNFESGAGSICQYTGDDFNWTVSSGSTPSVNTGPTAAYQGNGYFYMESSSPNYPSKVATFQSACYDLNGFSSADIDFWYHMYGTTMGTLNLEVSANNGTTWTNVWSLSGNQGNTWNNAVVDLSSYTGSNLSYRFTGTTTTSFTSDFTLDQVTVNASVNAVKLSSPVAVLAYPVPFKNRVIVELSLFDYETENGVITIMNAVGQEVYRKSVSWKNKLNTNFDASTWQSGVYYIYYKDENYSTVKKVLCVK